MTQLPKNLIQIWIAPINKPELSDLSFLEALDDSEKAKARSIKNEASRLQFLASRLLLRSALAKTTGVAPKSWQFSYDQYGKGRVAANAHLPRVFFSLSHCDQAIAIALSLQGEIGIDLEPIKQDLKPNPGPVVLTKEEQEYLQKILQIQRDKELIRIWTLKEAYAKLIGLGMNIDFLTFAINPAPLSLAYSSDRTIELSNVGLKTWEISVKNEMYQLSLAYQKKVLADGDIELIHSQTAMIKEFSKTPKIF